MTDQPDDPPVPVDKAADGALYYRALSSGLAITVWPMMWGQTYVVLGDDVVRHSVYAYFGRQRALEAARAWSGEGDPLDGWHRHLQTGRRREGGDPSKEIIQW